LQATLQSAVKFLAIGPTLKTLDSNNQTAEKTHKKIKIKKNTHTQQCDHN